MNENLAVFLLFVGSLMFGVGLSFITLAIAYLVKHTI